MCRSDCYGNLYDSSCPTSVPTYCVDCPCPSGTEKSRNGNYCNQRDSCSTTTGTQNRMKIAVNSVTGSFRISPCRLNELLWVLWGNVSCVLAYDSADWPVIIDARRTCCCQALLESPTNWFVKMLIFQLKGVIFFQKILSNF